MKDKSVTKLETKNEMLVYEAEGINLVDVYHLIQSQIQTINAQSKVIKELEKNAELLKQLDKVWDELNHERNERY
jgi:flagellin-specific chaperone FliS